MMRWVYWLLTVRNDDFIRTMMYPNFRFFGTFLWILAALGLLTLRESYRTVYLKRRYIPPVLRPNYLEFTIHTSEVFKTIDDLTQSISLVGTTTSHYNFSRDTTDTYRHILPWCTRSQIINGSWVFDLREKPPYVNPISHLQCYPKDKYRNAPWESWKWLPNDSASERCDYFAWREDDFCSLLPRATVAIIGDSLSWEHYSSLIQTHGLRTHQGFQHQSKELKTNIVQSVCNGQTKILYRRDDRLLNVTASIDQHFPTVLVLNRGAHFVPDYQLRKDIRHNIQEVRDWLAQCDTMKVKCHFFWRTSVPGHPGCINFTKPVNDITAMEELVSNRSLYDTYTIKYHWFDYQRQNELVLEEFRKAHLNSFEVIDAYYINMLRPDEHRHKQGDCLHNCYPGKMDVYNDIMLHFLRTQRTDIDIQRLVNTANYHGWTIHENTDYDMDATEEAKFFRVGHRDYERLFHEGKNLFND